MTTPSDKLEMIARIKDARERLAKDCLDTGIDHATHRRFFKRSDSDVMRDIETLLRATDARAIPALPDSVEREKALKEAAKQYIDALEGRISRYDEGQLTPEREVWRAALRSPASSEK